MLVLSRHKNESIVIGENIVVMVIDIRGDKVRLGVEAPKNIPINRDEVHKAIARSGGINKYEQTATPGVFTGVCASLLASALVKRVGPAEARLLIDGIERGAGIDGPDGGTGQETSPQRTETSPQRTETSPQRTETSPQRTEKRVGAADARLLIDGIERGAGIDGPDGGTGQETSPQRRLIDGIAQDAEVPASA